MMKFLTVKWKWVLGLAAMLVVALYGSMPAFSAPAIPLRGVVEGFYGTPWSQADRLSMLQFCHEHKLNAYIYAPKDDAYHRAKWREMYPADKMADLQALIDESKKQQVKFIFAISPGLDIHFSGQEAEQDKQAMLKKLTAMYDMGVRDFAIFFDDIKNKDGKGQAEFLNWVNNNFIAQHKDINPLIAVPTEYFRQDMESEGQIKEYTKDFSATLDKDILVLYTGEKVVPDGLRDVDYARANKLYGRQLGIWWNYPVSDYLEAKLALGPVEKLPMAAEIPAIFFNPMKHAELSKISLATGADYALNPGKYDAQKAWHKAIKAQYGSLAEDMEAFADQSQHMVVSWAVIGPEDGAELRQQGFLQLFAWLLLRRIDHIEFDKAIRANLLLGEIQLTFEYHDSSILKSRQAAHSNDAGALALFGNRRVCHIPILLFGLQIIAKRLKAQMVLDFIVYRWLLSVCLKGILRSGPKTMRLLLISECF